ncbi:hypothetical protein [Borreliella bavariensis]|nr:hypothetical protein [Borreliella bavariensis]
MVVLMYSGIIFFRYLGILIKRRIEDNADMFGTTIAQQYAKMKKEIK